MPNAVELPLFIDTTNRRAVLGPKNQGPFPLPQLFQEDQIALRIQFLTMADNAPRNNPFEIIPVGGLAVKVKIGSITENKIYGSQSVWDFDAGQNVITGIVDLNTQNTIDAMNAATGAPIAATFEIELNGITSFQSKVTINPELIKNGSPDALPLDQYYTKAEMDALFVKFYGNPPGSSITLPNTANDNALILKADADKSAGGDAA